MKFIYNLLIAIIFMLIGWFGNTLWHMPKKYTPEAYLKKEKPLEKYSIENLSKAKFESSQITLEGENIFSFTVEGKKITGLINIPEGEGLFPLIVMFRGYVDQKEYKTGDGTRRAGEYFAKNGFITIAPDFLGYGGSDKEAENIFESRFQTYVAAVTLLNSIENVPKWDRKNIFIWGHSNGGQIALTTLEITGKNFPTVLWAPVSKPFPYSILYYTDESDDKGKLIRSELSKFEEDYDVEKYSLTNFLDRVKAPIQIHQGLSDTAVPYSWSSDLSKKLTDSDYIKYPGVDHNLNPAWNKAITTSLQFYRKYLK